MARHGLCVHSQFDKAVTDYTEAIRLTRIPVRAADSYNDRGCAYGHMGDFDKAIADLNEAVRHDPKESRYRGIAAGSTATKAISTRVLPT